MNTSPIDNGVALLAGKYHVIATVPANAKSATVNARLISRDLSQNVKVRLANCPVSFVDQVDTPASADWLQTLDIVLGPDGIKDGMLEDTAIVMKAGRVLVAYAETAIVTAHAHGFLKSEV